MKLLRIGIILAFAAVILVFAVSFRRTEPKQATIPDSKEEVETTVDADQTIRPYDQVILEQGTVVWEIHADEARSFRKKGELVLLNLKDVRFLSEDGRKIRLQAKEGIWNSKNHFIKVNGDVIAVIEGGEEGDPITTLHTETLRYNRITQILTAEKPICIEREGIKVTGAGLRAYFRDRKFVVTGNQETHIDTLPRQEGGTALEQPLVLRSDQLEFNDRSRELLYSGGDPILLSGENMVHAELFAIYPDPSRKEMVAIGNVRATILVPDKLRDDPIIPDRTEKAHITSDRMRFTYPTRILTFEEQVHVIYGDRDLLADSVEIYLSPETNRMDGGIAQGSVEGRSEDWFLSCGLAILKNSTQSLVFTGNPSIRGRNASIRADRIYAFREDDEYLFEDNVQGYLKPESGMQTNLALSSLLTTGENAQSPVQFSADRVQFNHQKRIALVTGHVILEKDEQRLHTPRLNISFKHNQWDLDSTVFPQGVRYTRGEQVIVGEKGVYRHEDETVILEGSCKAWQGDSATSSDRMVLILDQDRSLASGNVETLINRKTDNPDNFGSPENADNFFRGDRGPVQINADKACFSQSLGEAVYAGNVKFASAGNVMETGELRILMTPDLAVVDTMEATGNVQIRTNVYRAACNRLFYSGLNQTITLVADGKTPCRIWMDDRGTEGERMTIYLQEKKLEVEGGQSLILPPAVPNDSNKMGAHQ